MEDVRCGTRGLIYEDITGFGDKGPDADLPAANHVLLGAQCYVLSDDTDAGATALAGGGPAVTKLTASAFAMALPLSRERTGRAECHGLTVAERILVRQRCRSRLRRRMRNLRVARSPKTLRMRQ